ncbi:MAG: hypothetical protein EBU66_14520 [Bacteroidetes bacterium]|nr:hypothetical protein [bacterium]NBP65861.1 hypothetical protein [Bacteroidota bacterium]
MKKQKRKHGGGVFDKIKDLKQKAMNVVQNSKDKFNTLRGETPDADPKPADAAPKAVSDAAPAPSAPPAEETASADAPPETAAKPETGKEGKSDSEKKKGMTLNDVFNMIYKVFAIIVAILFVAMSLSAIFDVFSYYKKELQQSINLKKDPNLFYKDTTDTEAIGYLNVKQDGDEPFSIFAEQKMVSYVLVLVGVTIIFIGIQVALYLGLKIYSVINKNKNNDDDKFYLDPRILAIIIVGGIGAVILNSIYKKRFINGSQKELIYIRATVIDVKRTIYKNLLKDAQFLSILLSNTNVNARLKARIIDMSNKTQNCASTGDDTETTDVCDDTTIQQAIFTWSLYSYYASTIPESDRAFKEIRQLFTVDGINKREIDPTQYFYYNQPVYITNIYSTIQDDITQNGFRVSAATASGSAKTSKDTTFDSEREQNMVTGLSNTFQDINTKLAQLQQIPSGKKKLRNYMFMFLLFTLIFTPILLILFKSELEPIRAFIDKWLANIKKQREDKKRFKAECKEIKDRQKEIDEAYETKFKEHYSNLLPKKLEEAKAKAAQAAETKATAKANKKPFKDETNPGLFSNLFNQKQTKAAQAAETKATANGNINGNKTTKGFFELFNRKSNTESAQAAETKATTAQAAETKATAQAAETKATAKAAQAEDLVSADQHFKQLQQLSL